MSEKLKSPGDFQSEFIWRAEKDEDLDSIAEKLGTTKQIIVSDNMLKETPSAGELLVIEKPKGKPYIVQPYDTIESLSGGDKKRELEILTNNKTDVIYVGQKIYL